MEGSGRVGEKREVKKEGTKLKGGSEGGREGDERGRGGKRASTNYPQFLLS